MFGTADKFRHRVQDSDVSLMVKCRFLKDSPRRQGRLSNRCYAWGECLTLYADEC